jgi:hypothetical protein
MKLLQLTPCSRSRHPIILRAWGLLRVAWWGFVLRCPDVYARCRIYIELGSIPSGLLSYSSLLQVISMVVDGSNDRSDIWLGVDAVITTSLPITVPHPFKIIHPIIHSFPRPPIASFHPSGDLKDSLIPLEVTLARCRHHYFNNSHLCPDTRRPFSKTSYHPLSWWKHICLPCHRSKN